MRAGAGAVSALAPVLEPAPSQPGPPSASQQLRNLAAKPYEFLQDDLNTPRAVAALFDLLKRLNTLAANPVALTDLSTGALRLALDTYRTMVTEVLGLRDEPRASARSTSMRVSRRFWARSGLGTG